MEKLCKFFFVLIAAYIVFLMLNCAIRDYQLITADKEQLYKHAKAADDYIKELEEYIESDGDTVVEDILAGDAYFEYYYYSK